MARLTTLPLYLFQLHRFVWEDYQGSLEKTMLSLSLEDIQVHRFTPPHVR